MTAVEIIHTCAERGIAVIAVDGHVFQGLSMAYPDLAAMMTGERGYKGDWEDWVRGCAEAALRLIEEFSSKPGYVFDVDPRSKQTWEEIYSPC